MVIGRFQAGIAALIWDSKNDKYLVLRRSAHRDFGAGLWECVTGRVDQGESFEEALHREVLEELGIKVKIAVIAGTTHFYRGEQTPDNELVGVVFLCTTDTPDSVVLSPEHDTLRWLSEDEAELFLDEDTWVLKVIRRAALLHLILGENIISHWHGKSIEIE